MYDSECSLLRKQLAMDVSVMRENPLASSQIGIWGRRTALQRNLLKVKC